VYPLIVATQWIGKNITAAMNTGNNRRIFKKLFSIQPMSYQRKVGDYFFPELLVA
jgi:hypothetical protein